MKKPKISLDPQAIQTFLLNHIEKILLVIVVMLMLGVVYKGYSVKGPPADKVPEKMVNEANQTKQYIEDPNRWNEVSLKPERQVDFDVVRKVGEVQQKSNPLAYSLPNPWSRPDFPKLSPRQDPELYAPVNLVVRPVVGSLASYWNTFSNKEYSDPLLPQLTEEEIRKMREKKRAEEKKKKKDDLAGSEYAGGDMPGGPGGPGGKTKRGRGRNTGEDAGMPGPGGRGTRGGGAMPGSAMPGSEYGGGYAATGPLTAGMPYPEAQTYGYQVTAADSTIARDVAAVTVMAVVPFQKQMDEYDKKLGQSLDYDPSRDFPQYLEFQAQRVDVTDLDPDAPIDEKAWQSLPRAPKILEEQAYGNEKEKKVPLFAGAPVEVCDPNYLEPETLTHYAPPFLQRDLWDLLTHPDVPLYTPVLQLTETGAAGAAPGQDNDAPSMGALLNRPGMGSGMAGDGAGGGYRSGGGMMPGGPGGMSRPGLPGPGMGGMGGGMGGMPRPGGFSRGGEESGYGAYGGMQQTYTPPKYKLVRFTDTNVQRGHKYRYRVRLFVSDPNHPAIGAANPPSSASLHPDVQKRVKALDEADAKRTAETKLPYRTFWRMSDWSEPSPVAELPTPARLFAVKVSPAAPQKVVINGKPIDVQIADPKADGYTVVFDDRKIADVPAESDKITRGSVLNYEVKETYVIHPVTKEPVKLEKYNVHSDLVVADMMGGERLPIVDTKSLTTSMTALGEILVVDSEGRLHVQNEAQDVENIRRFTVVKEDPTKPKQPMDTGDAPGLDTGTRPGGRRRQESN